ncbi:MAG: MBL fold metallo-hydrolase [Propionibacteriaceae bacterium]
MSETFHGQFLAGQVWSIAVGTLANNAYLVVDSHHHGHLIDAAAEPDLLRSWITRHCQYLESIITTHRHHDHHGALSDLAAAFPHSTCWAGKPDVDAISATGVRPTPIWSGASLAFAGQQVPVLGLRGHTPGGIALDLGGALIVGDSLFPGGLGKTATPEDFTQLYDDVTTTIFAVYPAETVILPGHGVPTTLGAEQPHLLQWRERGW